LRKFFGKIAFELLAKINKHPVQITPKVEVLNLIKQLYPINPGIELIRLGSDSDGGYLLPNDLEGIAACYSPGVGPKSDFETDLANLGIEVFMADKSVKSPNSNHNKFHFIHKFVGSFTSEDYITMDEWFDTSIEKCDSDLILQMDIEKFEYETIMNMSDKLLNRFRIIIIEFHYLNYIWDNNFFQMLIGRVFEKILKNHTCVHIHPNNTDVIYDMYGIKIPITMEFTFLRNDRIKQICYRNDFPHPLDRKNVDFLDDLILPEVWYKK
jgi:hypothetical protein